MNADIRYVQSRLKAAGFDPGPLDGDRGPKFDAALEAALVAARGGAPIPADIARTGAPGLLTDQDIADAAAALNVPPATIRAVREVEARGQGFDPATGLPIILYEPHVFHRETGGRFSAQHGGVSYAKWGDKPYPKTQGARWDQMKYAQRLDNPAALKSASWGMFQIMGFNHAACGYPRVEDFVDAMGAGEREQLMAFVHFVQHEGLDDELRRQDWAGFARRYNGAGFAKNKYDQKLAAAFKKYGGR